jgi:hypothetical protein
MIATAVLLVASACTSAAVPSGAFDAETVTARDEARTAEVALLERTSMASPAAEGVADSCRAGQDNWKVRDHYRWTCSHTTTWIVASEIADASELIATYRAHLVASGCQPTYDFDQLEYYWSTLGAAGENAHGEPYTIDDLLTGDAECGEGEGVSVRFGTPQGFDETWAYQSLGGQVIEDRAIQIAAVRALTAPHIVMLQTGTGYHYVSRYPEPETEPEDDGPPPCFCHSGGDCDCPGG